MWVLKSKFNMALIIAIILMLSLIGVWYVIPVPKVSPLIVSDLENLDAIATMEGTLGKKGYLLVKPMYGDWNVSILIKAHIYTTNGTIRLQNTTAINLTNPVCTRWRAISETDALLDNKYHIQSWKDIDEDEKLSSSDQIYMNKTEPAPVGPWWYDVQEVWKYGAFCNIIALPRTGDNIILIIDTTIARADTICLQNTTAINLTNPVCTQWDAISYPDVRLGKKYHIQSWKDIDEDEKLSSSDQIKMDITKPAMDPRWCDVQEVEYGAICNMTITNETIPEVSGISTYVFNKLTHENEKDAPEANKPREGYDPFYPLHLKPDEDIPNAWLDNLDETGTLKFVEAVKIEDVELYEYFVNKTITKEMVLPGVNFKNYTLTSTKRVLIEPLSGLPVYTKNETFIIWGENRVPIVYLTYKDKELDLVTPRLARGAMQVLEFDKEVKGWILGAIVVILTVAFIFSARSLSRARKILPKAKK